MNIFNHIARRIFEYTNILVKPFDPQAIETDILMLDITSIKLLEVEIPTFEIAATIYRKLGAQDLEWDQTLELLTLPLDGLAIDISIQRAPDGFIVQSIELNIEITKIEDEEDCYYIDKIDTESKSLGKICVKKRSKNE